MTTMRCHYKTYSRKICFRYHILILFSVFMLMFNSASSLPGSQEYAYRVNGKTIALNLLNTTPPDLKEKLAEVSKQKNNSLYRVLQKPENGALLLLSNELIVELNAGQSISDLPALLPYPIKTIAPLRGSARQFKITLDILDPLQTLETVNYLSNNTLVAWAEPNLRQQIRESLLANDTYFDEQWYLEAPVGDLNEGEGVDVNIAGAWDLEVGRPDIVIAVLDDGVETSHYDLDGNIFRNPGEVPENSLDDDGNGFIDDVNGWNFYNNDADVDPQGADDIHGTPMAGLIAAEGFNQEGLAGVCPACKVLPIKINYNNQFVDNASIAEAIRYATEYADIINGSWTLEQESEAIISAINDGHVNGRGGKGALFVFAAGNSNTLPSSLSSSIQIQGTHRYTLQLTESASVGDAPAEAWIKSARIPGAAPINFPGEIPENWEISDNTQVTLQSNPKFSNEESCKIEVLKLTNASPENPTEISFTEEYNGEDLPETVSFSGWLTGSEGAKLLLEIDEMNDGVVDSTRSLSPRDYDFSIGFPAYLDASIAIGAVSEYGCRTNESRFGEKLDFVAPSGGVNTSLLEVLDRTGKAGYETGSYVTRGRGTSAAAAIASGVIGLMLSHNPQLTAQQVYNILRESSNEIGIEPNYIYQKSERYGYGLLDATKALQAVASTTTEASHAYLTIHLVGEGEVNSSNVDGIRCGYDCSHEYELGTVVQLEAIAKRNSKFASFGGSANCANGMVTVQRNTICSVKFSESKTNVDEGDESNPGAGALSVELSLFCYLLILAFRLITKREQYKGLFRPFYSHLFNAKSAQSRHQEYD
ncbi:subtilase family protein [Alteromonadaceae bacterium 2753L.S.0a.02]|nr:subtilase family protein [Alteromonadaceae bacterium 2753L.S.0a.02]